MATDIDKYIDSVPMLLENHRLRDAVIMLKRISSDVLYKFAEKNCKELDMQYNMLLEYVQRGAEDPHRLDFYNDYCAQAYDIYDAILTAREGAESTSLYHGNLRADKVSGRSLGDAVNGYMKLLKSNSLFDAIADGSETVDRAKQLELAIRQVFTGVWTMNPLSNVDINIVRGFLSSEVVPERDKIHIIPAILLATLQCFNSKYVDILFETYINFASTGKSISIIALTTSVLVLLLFRKRPIRMSTKKLLESASQSPTWKDDIRTVLVELVKTIDTERVNRKVINEILPEIRKIQKGLMEMFKNVDVDEKTFDIAMPDENPEWIEKFENSAAGDKVRELHNLQIEGSDVNFTAYQQLKMFPFFSEIANWFVPFSLENSVVTSCPEVKDMSILIDKIPGLCDSDKYSTVLVYTSAAVAKVQKDLLLNQMKVVKMNEAMLHSDVAAKSKKDYVADYVHNLYRFFKLFRRKGEFKDPFASPFDIAGCKYVFSETDTTEQDAVEIADYYFKHKYYKEALKIFLFLREIGKARADVHQKIGYCHQMMGKLREALDSYLCADLMSSGDIWTQNRIAQCYQLLGCHKDAIEYFDMILVLDKDNLGVLAKKAISLMALREYREALKVLTKIDYLKPNNLDIVRALTRCQVMLGKFDEASQNFEKIVAANPTMKDYVLMGHAALARKDFAEAINCYELAAERDDNRLDNVITEVKQSEDELRHLGVDMELIPLVLDCLIRLDGA